MAKFKGQTLEELDAWIKKEYPRLKDNSYYREAQWGFARLSSGFHEGCVFDSKFKYNGMSHIKMSYEDNSFILVNMDLF